MTAPEHGHTTGPYADAAATYWQAGWRGLLPLPHTQKAPVPKGWTGRDGAWPSWPDIQAWTEDHPAGNIALRLPPDVIGIDVDHYDGKPGGLVLHQLEQTLGPLPATWRTTSRDDGTSGIRLYRIPTGLRWPGVLGPGIETIRHEHRYAVTWPSIHPSGGTYRWIRPDGTTSLHDVPSPDDLPDLPDQWIQHFTGGELATDQPKADLTDSAAGTWLHQRGQGPTCRGTDRALARSLDLSAAGARHDAMLAGTNRLVWLAGEGHTGATQALHQLKAAFLAATSGDRHQGEAEAEWDRALAGAVRMAAAAHPQLSPDPCADPFAGLIARKDQPCAVQPAEAPETPSTTTPTTGSPTTKDSPSPAPIAPDPANATAETTTRQEATAAVAETTDETAQRADDATEEQIRRNQAAAQELERIRAQRAAQRLLDAEDEDQVIADRVRSLLLRDKATAAYRLATEPPAPAFDAGTLAEVLARPDDPPMRADGLIPWEASTLLVAARKTGKTTCLLNYARSLLTGEPFLGEFPVIPLEPGQAIALLNFEVTGKMVARWAHDIGVDPDRFYLVNLRGRRNPLSRDDDRADLAGMLKEINVGALMVDPFGRAFTGESQNDNAEVQRFLVDLDTFTRNDVGATDLILAAHAGWDGERTRGASALEDWPDTIINLATDEEGDKRYMRALGRDVDVDEDELVMDPLTRLLSRAGTGGRKTTRRAARAEQAVSEVAVLVTRVVNQNRKAMSQNDIKAAVANLPGGDARKVGESVLGRAVALAADGEFIIAHKGVGPRRSHVIHRRDDDCSHCSEQSSEQSHGTAPGALRSSPGAVQSPDRSEANTPGAVKDPLTGARINLDTGEVLEP